MKLRYLAYAGILTATAVAIASPTPSSAKAKKAEMEPAPLACWFLPESQVCGSRGSVKTTYYNSCYAEKDGAKIASHGDCKAGKMAKKKMAQMKMKM